MSFDDLFSGMDDAQDDVHEEMARGVADELRDAGVTSADGVDLPLDPSAAALPFAIDVERIRRRANEILADG